MQNFYSWIGAVALEPTICERLGVCRTCACDPFTQRWLPRDDKRHSSETLLNGHVKLNPIFYEIVGDMVFRRRARVRLDLHISHMALNNRPAMTGMEFREYPASYGDPSQHASRHK